MTQSKITGSIFINGKALPITDITMNFETPEPAIELQELNAYLRKMRETTIVCTGELISSEAYQYKPTGPVVEGSVELYEDKE